MLIVLISWYKSNRKHSKERIAYRKFPEYYYNEKNILILIDTNSRK